MSFLVWRFRRKSMITAKHLNDRVAAATMRTCQCSRCYIFSSYLFDRFLMSYDLLPGWNNSPEVTPFTLVEPFNFMASQVSQQTHQDHIPTNDDAAPRPVYSPGSGYTIRGVHSSEKIRPHCNTSQSHATIPSSPRQSQNYQALHPESPQVLSRLALEQGYARDDDCHDFLDGDSPPSYRISSPLVVLANSEHFQV
jgi:hypothetical protein